MIKKRKTARWSKGWSYIDPEMEMLRLQEDAIEKGKAVDVVRIERLQAEDDADSRPSSRGSTVASKRKSGARVSENLRPRPSSSAGSSTIEKGKSVLGRAKEKMLPRSNSVRSNSVRSVKGKSAAAASAPRTSLAALEREESEFRLPELDFTYKSGSPDLLPALTSGISNTSTDRKKENKTSARNKPSVVVTSESDDEGFAGPGRAPSVLSANTATDRGTIAESLEPEEVQETDGILSLEGGAKKGARGVKRSLGDAGKIIGSVVSKRRSLRGRA